MTNTAEHHTDPTGSAIKGLATVAMLKANFDEGRDHLAMFEPFLRDAVATFPADDMDTKQVRAAVVSRHGLQLPENATRTLLQRIVRQGYLRREGGRYFRTGKALSSADVLDARRAAEDRQGRLALGLIDSANERNIKITSSNDALALIMSFMEAYHVRLAFDEPPDFDGNHDESTSKSPQHVATALFLRDVVIEQSDYCEIVQEILEGFVLQNALLLRDISQVSRQFDDLQVLLDSQILFGALGLRGPTVKTAATELLNLLKQTGATLCTFDPTLSEMRRVLQKYEEKVGTAKGREELYISDLTRHVLNEEFTPADIKQETALLESKLHALDIAILALPERIPKWTLDEAALAKVLAGGSGREDEPRVVHDIDCVAGVLTYREGKTAHSLDSCGAIFVTNSGMTVRQVQHWYAKQGGKGAPPIIHELSLSNYAWLKQPASAAKLKVHELVALCAAALRPSREVWDRFVHHLRNLEKSGQISSDELAAVVASELTQNALAEGGIDEDSDAESLSEVVERVRSRYRTEADAAVQRANKEMEKQRDELTRLRQRVTERAGTVARTASGVVFGLLTISFLAGAVLSIVDAISGATPSLLAGLLALVPFAVLGVLSVSSGFHLKAGKERFEGWVAAKVGRWMLHGQPVPEESREREPRRGSDS